MDALRYPPVVTRLLVLLLALLLGFSVATPVAAQSRLDWREQATTYFTLQYAPGSEATAADYATWVDAIYEELALAFGHRTVPPLTLKLYPTSETYFADNPAARNVPGVVAHADFRRRELVVIIERTAMQTPEEVRNNVRHELTHIVVADLGGGRVNTGFQEGIAQYMERPTAELDRRIESLRLAHSQGRLLSWSSFDDRNQIYGQPDLAYPQTLSVVAFLIDRDGFARFREFLTVTARSSGYRSALERTYNAAPSTLEAEWQAWLPAYLAGGYRQNAMTVYDLGLARDLVAQGSYAAAQQELEGALAWLERQAATQPPELAAEARTLLQRSEAGMRADQLAESARQALERADYTRANELIRSAEALYGSLGDARQAEVLAIYTERAARGLNATARLIEADALTRTLRYPEAREAAEVAAREFAALGDQLRYDNALALRSTLDQRQRWLGVGLLGIGALGVFFSLLGRLFARPAEIW
ncbi:MAG: peptidase MA family metallohydrolase [Oscillochloridaceae bacterium umkhey_bin13]